MTRTDLVFVVRRAFSIYFTIWALFQVTYLPALYMNLSHHQTQNSVLVSNDYWATYYAMEAILTAGKIVALVIAAIVFWNGGPAIESWFTPGPAQE
jgi:hypothetical protein